MPLPAAGKHWCFISFVGYSYLLIMGIIHFYHPNESNKTERLRMQTLILCGLYIYESFLALFTNTSTIYKWRLFEFISHHIPFVLITIPLIYDPVVPNVYKYTLPLIFVLNGQELYRVLNQNNIRTKFIDQILPFYVLVIVVLLIFIEIWESMQILFYIPIQNLSNQTMIGSFCGGTIIPLYHMVIVIPSAYKRICKVIANMS